MGVMRRAAAARVTAFRREGLIHIRLRANQCEAGERERPRRRRGLAGPLRLSLVLHAGACASLRLWRQLFQFAALTLGRDAFGGGLFPVALRMGAELMP